MCSELNFCSQLPKKTKDTRFRALKSYSLLLLSLIYKKIQSYKVVVLQM